MATRIVLRDRQTSLYDCVDVIEADAAIRADNAEAEGRDPAAAALAYTRMALHAIADSLVIAEEPAKKKPGRPKKPAKKWKPGRPKKPAEKGRSKKKATKKRT